MAGHKEISSLSLDKSNDSQEIILINQYASLRDLPAAVALKNFLRKVLPIEITKLETESQVKTA